MGGKHKIHKHPSSRSDSSRSSSSSHSLRNIRTQFDSSDESSHVLHLVPPSSADRSPLKSWRNLPSPESTIGDYHTLYDSEQAYVTDPYSDDDKKAPFVHKGSGSRRSKKRTINYLTLGFIAYFAVASGPFGIEDAVRAAGPYPVLVMVLILPLTWGLPQALMACTK